MAPIRKVLIANRGEIASRIIRAAHELDIATVAVFSHADAFAPYVNEADEAVGLDGNAPSQTYLDIDQLLEAARLSGADAVHPGYGFLSERSAFARACAEAGLTFVGPHPDTIEAMGSKIKAKELMSAAGVPVLPGLAVNSGEDLEGVFLKDHIERIGLPILVKAAYGGGGRGMRIVEDVNDLQPGIEAAQREAASAFGDGTVFLERYIERPRHIEVQIFGDAYGAVAHLFERECSIQRRYQKILEEAPSPAVDNELRERLGAAAVAAGRAISYVGAGTVEFVLDQDGHFYFLEVNTRLQVEHPVTEMVTGIDLVKLQFLVAEGHPLPPEVAAAEISGHAVEVRLYAEDVGRGFIPAAGTLQEFRLPQMDGIRIDTGVVDGSEVSIHYDPMLAKVIAYAPTRLEACRKLASALRSARIHGVVTNRDLLIGILRDPDFEAGVFDTSFLARPDLHALLPSTTDMAVIHPLAAALAAQWERRSESAVLGTIPSGWRNVPNSLQETSFLVDDERVCVRYGYRRDALGDTRALVAQVNDVDIMGIELRNVSSWRVDLEVEGVRRQMRIQRVGDLVFVDSSLGASALREEPRFPDPAEIQAAGSLRAPMPGTVVRADVSVGDKVTKGASVIVLEAMKMEHVIRAPVDGVVVEIRIEAGQTVDVGVVLAVVQESEAAADE
jgi:acetyl/propionyl-CoA carboxylase alpha subunit